MNKIYHLFIATILLFASCSESHESMILDFYKRMMPLNDINISLTDLRTLCDNDSILVVKFRTIVKHNGITVESEDSVYYVRAIRKDSINEAIVHCSSFLFYEKELSKNSENCYKYLMKFAQDQNGNVIIKIEP